MKHWFSFLLIFVLLCAGLYGWGAAQPTDLQRAARSGDLVRIHILAHDDSERQQAVKLRVRDAILEAFTPLLQKAESAADAARIVERHLDLAQETAEKTLQEENDPLQVRVEFGTFDFPERVYGGQVVPAGEYRALRILLGDGAGKNWWCVMYPPLCFSGEDVTGEVHFESTIAKWIKKYEKWKEERKHAEEEKAAQADAEPCAAARRTLRRGDADSGCAERLLGQQGRSCAAGAAEIAEMGLSQRRSGRRIRARYL